MKMKNKKSLVIVGPVLAAILVVVWLLTGYVETKRIKKLILNYQTSVGASQLVIALADLAKSNGDCFLDKIGNLNDYVSYVESTIHRENYINWRWEIGDDIKKNKISWEFAINIPRKEYLENTNKYVLLWTRGLDENGEWGEESPYKKNIGIIAFGNGVNYEGHSLTEISEKYDLVDMQGRRIVKIEQLLPSGAIILRE